MVCSNRPVGLLERRQCRNLPAGLFNRRCWVFGCRHRHRHWHWHWVFGRRNWHRPHGFAGGREVLRSRGLMMRARNGTSGMRMHLGAMRSMWALRSGVPMLAAVAAGAMFVGHGSGVRQAEGGLAAWIMRHEVWLRDGGSAAIRISGPGGAAAGWITAPHGAAAGRIGCPGQWWSGAVRPDDRRHHAAMAISTTTTLAGGRRTTVCVVQTGMLMIIPAVSGEEGPRFARGPTRFTFSKN